MPSLFRSKSRRTSNNSSRMAVTVGVRAKARVLVNSTMLEQQNGSNNKEPINKESINTKESDNKVVSIPEDTWDNVDYYADYWNLTPDQLTDLLALRDALSDIDHRFARQPHMVVRFFRTEDFNAKRAEIMFRKMIKWRQTNALDGDDQSTLERQYKPPPELLDKYPGAILKGCDRDGDPVFLSRMGVTDMVGLVDKYGHDAMIRFEIYKREAGMAGPWIPEWEHGAGRPVKHITIIEDMQGLSRRLLSTKVATLYGDAMELDQGNYPDAAKKIIIIRAPTVFRMAWSVGKRFFPLFIQQKMEFCGPSDYLKVLEKYIDLDILPPCIYPEGHGEAALGNPPNFLGGKVPK